MFKRSHFVRLAWAILAAFLCSICFDFIANLPPIYISPDVGGPNDRSSELKRDISNKHVEPQRERHSNEAKSRDLDAVITWVNGSDPIFQESMQRAIADDGLKIALSAKANRFADHDDLKLLLRSLEKYGGIFRFIFLVLSGPSQIPSWLNTNNPRLKIVFHYDIWSDASQLPVFNSLAIEINLHHIKGLSDAFVYINDDITILNELTYDDFVVPGRFQAGSIAAIKIRPDIPLPPGYVVSENGSDSHWVGPAMRTHKLINKTCAAFKESISANGYLPNHTPHLLMRSVLYHAEGNPSFSQLFQSTSAARFRNGTELNTVMLFNSYAQCVSNLTTIWARKTELVYIGINTGIADLPYYVSMQQVIKIFGKKIQNGELKFLCLNDVSDSGVVKDVGRKTAKLAYKWRRSMFPDKCSFEL